jgi:hypothetical protein
VPRTLPPYETGIIHHASQRYVTSNERQTFPELHGTRQTKLDTPKLHVPDVTIATSYEIPQLQSISPPKTDRVPRLSRTLYHQPQHAYLELPNL